MQGMWVRFTGWGTKIPQVSQSEIQNIKQKHYCNMFNKKTLKMVHIKKKKKSLKNKHALNELERCRFYWDTTPPTSRRNAFCVYHNTQRGSEGAVIKPGNHFHQKKSSLSTLANWNQLEASPIWIQTLKYADLGLHRDRSIQKEPWIARAYAQR